MMLMAFVYILTMMAVPAAAYSYVDVPQDCNPYLQNNSIEEIDAVLVACSVLNSSDPENDILVSKDTAINLIIPLYSEIGDVVAYYISFSPSGYAVINNNKNNPTAIEFGQGKHPQIEELFDTNIDARIIYNNPTEVYVAYSKLRSTYHNTDLYSYFPALKSKNSIVVTQLNRTKELIASCINLYSDGDYGFIDWEDMPSGTYDWDIIPNAVSTDWATTSEFTSIAKDHCGATAVTNLALYFANCGYSDLKKDSVYDTFVAVHDIVGNGPVMTIAGSAKKYFSRCGYNLSYRSVGNFDSVKGEIGKGRPCGILLANAILDWHWVICVGYRDYTPTETGEGYMRIVDGWNDTTERFYLCSSGSEWISSTSYNVA